MTAGMPLRGAPYGPVQFVRYESQVSVKPLWSVGVSWHMAQEKFMGNMDWLDQLSIRFTKGINGNIAKQADLI